MKSEQQIKFELENLYKKRIEIWDDADITERKVITAKIKALEWVLSTK